MYQSSIENNGLRSEITELELLLKSCRESTCPTNGPPFDNAGASPEPDGMKTISDVNNLNDDSKHDHTDAEHEPELIRNNGDSIGNNAEEAYCNARRAKQRMAEAKEYEMCDVSVFAEEFGLMNAIKMLKGSFCEKDHIIRKLISDYQKRRRDEKERDEEVARLAREKEEETHEYDRDNEMNRNGWKAMGDGIDKMRNKHMHRGHYDD